MLYLIRHGATVPNESQPPILQGCGVDSDLSATGREQAAALATRLADVPLAAVFASRLQRAQQTAAAVAEPHGLTVQTAADIHEISAGSWERQTWPQIMADDPRGYARWAAAPDRVAFPGGESYLDVLARAQPVLERLAAEASESRPVAVVAHRVVNRAVCGHLLGLDSLRWRDVPQDNAAVNVLQWHDDRLRLVTLNSQTRLPRR